jgi:hypothetical protein
MKNTLEDVELELSKTDSEMMALNSEIEKLRHVTIPSEVEPGTRHRIKLPEKEFLRAAGDLLRRYVDLKRDRRALHELLVDLRRKRSEGPAKTKTHSADEEPVDLRTGLEDFMFNLDFKSLAARRTARLVKIAACACGEMKTEDHEDIDYMSHQNTRAILEQAIFIAKTVSEHFRDGHKMDDWLEDKISKVADDMDEIYKYLKHGKG